MTEVFFSEAAGWFTLPAAVGTFFFVLRLVMMLFAGDVHDGGIDVHGDVGVGDVHGDVGDVHAGGDGGADHPDSSNSFKVLSLQAIAAFLMGFGWGGIGCYRGSGLEVFPSIVIATLIGAGMVWLLSMLFKFVYSLESSGNISISSALGQSGIVYVTVPAERSGRGQVKVTISGRQRIFNAVSEGVELASHTPVKVVQINPDNTLTVSAS